MNKTTTESGEELRSFVHTTASGQDIQAFRLGAPDGAPLLYCHGWPGSGIQAALAGDAGKRLGFSILSLDRPGIGGSSFFANRKITDWPETAVELAQAQGWESFHILAVSGGCPYALATAATFPERVRSVHICCGAAEPDYLLKGTLSYPVYRWLLHFHRHTPGLLLLGLQAARVYLRIIPESLVFVPFLPFIPPADRKAVRPKAKRKLLARSVAASFRQHPRGILHDATRYIEGWGFSPSEVRAPTVFHHGTADRNIPMTATRKTSEKISGATFIEWNGEGHYSLPLNRLNEIINRIRHC